MTDTDDFYDLLGVERDATQEEIRRAFRQQVRKYHPDLNDDPRAPAQFTALKKAYDTLGDPEERKAYERMGHADYVRKRINGLPSPDQWQVPGDGDGKRTATDARGTTTGGGATATGGAEGATGAADPGSNGSSAGASDAGTPGSGTGAGTTHSGTHTGTGTGTGTGSRSRSAGSRSAASASGTATSRSRPAASGSRSSGTAMGGTSGPGTARPDWPTRARRGLQWLKRASLGWPLIIVADMLYLVGLEFYLIDNADGFQRLLMELAGGGPTAGGVSAALSTRHGVRTLPAFVRSDVSAGAAVGGLLVIAGAAALPSVYFFIIRETRTNRTPWRPSYLFVAAALAPAVGLILDLALSTPGLYLEVVAYVLLPLGAILGLPASAFLRPKLKRLFRRHWRRLRS